MSVLDVRNALLSVIDHVYHYKAPEKDADGSPIRYRYVVWGETGCAEAEKADDRTQILRITGELYYYTVEEYDTVLDDLCRSLTEYGVAWSIGNIGYDSDLGQIVYSLTWEVPCGACALYSG